MSPYTSVAIYYFSGTGNSKNVATWLSGVAEERGITCTLTDIGKVNRLELPLPPDDALIIFVSPVHGFNYPPIMLNFILHFRKGKNKIALVNTRAGMLIGKWITPGLSGITFYFSALILILKGYSIKALYPVNLPSNWISVHPGLNKRTVEYLHVKNKQRVKAFCLKILSGGSEFRSVLEIIQDVLVAPIAIGYYCVGRFFLAKTYYASGDCDSCNVCIKNCPVHAIKTIDNRPYWTIHCESCMKCLGNCPKKAIETAHGFAAFVLLVYNLIFLLLYYKYFPFDLLGGRNMFVSFIVESLFFVFGTSALYYLVHYMMRFRLFERAMVYTSLSKYRFWGRRYKALKP